MQRFRLFFFLSTFAYHIITILSEDIESLGCWKDSNKKRALVSMEHKHHFLDDPYPKRSNAVKKCAQVAIDHGFDVFGIQNGGQCFSGANADKRYNMHGPSNLCKGGKGGKWSSDIYSTKTFHSRSIHKSMDPSPWDPYCSRDLDVVILMDGSGPVNKKNKERWSEMKKFCAKFVKGFDEHARIGLIRFGSDPEIVVDMHKGEKADDIGDEIKTMDMPGGPRSLNDALKRAWREQMKESNRSAADKVILAITTGDIPYGLYGSSQFLSDHDVRVIAVGVDKNVHYEFLQSIASYRDVSNVFSVNSEQLAELAPFVYRDVCNTMPEYVSAPSPPPTKDKATEKTDESAKNTTVTTNSTDASKATTKLTVDKANVTSANTTNNSTDNAKSSNATTTNNSTTTAAKSRHVIPQIQADTIKVVGHQKHALPVEEVASKKGHLPGTVFDTGMKKNVVTAVKKGASKEEVATMVLVNPSPELNLFITDAEAKEIHDRKPTGEVPIQYVSTSKDTVSQGDHAYDTDAKLPSYIQNASKTLASNLNPDINTDQNVFSDVEGMPKNENSAYDQDERSLETLSNTDDKTSEILNHTKEENTNAENMDVSDKTAKLDAKSSQSYTSRTKALKAIDSSNHNKDVPTNAYKILQNYNGEQEADKMNSKLLKLKSMEREDLNETADVGNNSTSEVTEQAEGLPTQETMTAENVKQGGGLYYDTSAAGKENTNKSAAKAEMYDGGEKSKVSDSKIMGPGVVSQTVELHDGNGKQHVSEHPEMHVDYNNFFSGKLNNKMKAHGHAYGRPKSSGRTIITPDTADQYLESTESSWKTKNIKALQNSSALVSDAGRELAEIYDKVHKINADLDSAPAKHEKSDKVVNSFANRSAYQFKSGPEDSRPSVFEMDVENETFLVPSAAEQTKSNSMNQNELSSKETASSEQVTQKNGKEKESSKESISNEAVQSSDENAAILNKQPIEKSAAAKENDTAPIGSLPAENAKSANGGNSNQYEQERSPAAAASDISAIENKTSASFTNASEVLSDQSLKEIKHTQMNNLPFSGNVLLQADRKVASNGMENEDGPSADHLTKKQDVDNTKVVSAKKAPSDVETVGSLVGAVEQVSKDAAALAQEELDNMGDRRNYRNEDQIGGDYNEGMTSASNFDYAISDDETTRNALAERREEINNLLKILDREDQNNLLGKNNAKNRNQIEYTDESLATRELKEVFDKINSRIRFIHNKQHNNNKQTIRQETVGNLKDEVTGYGDSGAIRNEPVVGKINIDGTSVPFVFEEMSNHFHDNDSGDVSHKGDLNVRRKASSNAKKMNQKNEIKNKNQVEASTTEAKDGSSPQLVHQKENKGKPHRVMTNALVINKDDVQDVKTSAVSFKLPTKAEPRKQDATGSEKLPRIKTSALTIQVDDVEKGKHNVDKLLQSYAKHIQEVSNQNNNQIGEHNKKIVTQISKLVDAIKPVNAVPALRHQSDSKIQTVKTNPSLYPGPSRSLQNSSNRVSTLKNVSISFIPVPLDPHKPTESKVYTQPTDVDPNHLQVSNFHVAGAQQKTNQLSPTVLDSSKNIVGQIVKLNPALQGQNLNLHPVVNNAIITYTGSDQSTNNAIRTHTGSVNNWNKSVKSYKKPYTTVNHAHTKTLINNKGPTIGAYDNEELVQSINTLKTFVNGNKMQDHMFVNLNGINQKPSNHFVSGLPMSNSHELNLHKMTSNLAPGHSIGLPFKQNLKENYQIANSFTGYHGSKVLRPSNITLEKKLLATKYKQLNLNTLSRKNFAPKHVKKPHKAAAPVAPADVSTLKPIGQIKPRLNSHARPTLVPHHPPDSSNLFEHVQKKNKLEKSKLRSEKGEKKTLPHKVSVKDSLGWAKQEIKKERKRKKIRKYKNGVSGSWTEISFKPHKGNPLLRKTLILNEKRGNTKMASTLRKILLASSTNGAPKRLRKHRHKNSKAFLRDEEYDFNILDKKIKSIEASLVGPRNGRRHKMTVHAEARGNLPNTRQSEKQPQKSITAKKTFLGRLNKRGRPITEQDVITVPNYWGGRYASNPAPNLNTYSRNMPAKTSSGGANAINQIAKELYRVRKLYNSRVKGNEYGKTSSKHTKPAKKQAINNKVNDLDILNLEDKPEANWKDLITGELDKEILSEDDQIKLYNEKISDKNKPTKSVAVGSNTYLFETTPAMSKQIIYKASKPKPNIDHDVITEADFPKRFSISDFKLTDLPTLSKGKSYVLSTPSLGYVLVKIRDDSSFDDVSRKKDSYFREIEELSPEEVSKHSNSEPSKSYATEKEIAEAVHKADTEGDVSDLVQTNIPHEKTFIQIGKEINAALGQTSEEATHSTSTEGRKLQPIVTYVGNPVSRHRALDTSRDIQEQSDEPQYHTSKLFGATNAEKPASDVVHNTVDFIKTEDTYEPLEVQLSREATSPRIVTTSILKGDNTVYSNSSNMMNSSIESNVNDAESEGLINMVHSVIKENAKESKNFLHQKPKGSLIVGATLTPQKDNDGELSSLINKIHSLNSEIKDESNVTSTPAEQESLDNKNSTVFTTDTTGYSTEVANKTIGSLPQLTDNASTKATKNSDENEVQKNALLQNGTKTRAEIGEKHSAEKPWKNASSSQPYLKNTNITLPYSTEKIQNETTSSSANNTSPNKKRVQQRLDEAKMAAVFDKSETPENNTEIGILKENKPEEMHANISSANLNVPWMNNTEDSPTSNKFVNNNPAKENVEDKNFVKNMTNSSIELMKSGKEENHVDETNVTLAALVKNQTNSNNVESGTPVQGAVVGNAKLQEKRNSTIDESDTTSMSSLEYTLGCRKPLRILYAIDVSDGLGGGVTRKKRWHRLKDFIGSINRDVIHDVRHQFMVYNVEPRFLKSLDSCDKDTEYFMTADECLCGKKDLMRSSSGCSVNNPTMGENVEDWGTNGPRTGQALARARREFFNKNLHKYKNVIFLISHKDSVDSVERAENDLKKDGISLVDIELGDRHDLKRRNTVQRIHPHSQRRSNIENDSPSSDEHKMKVSLKKLQTTLRNIVGKVCKAQTDDDASKKSSIHKMSI